MSTRASGATNHEGQLLNITDRNSTKVASSGELIGSQLSQVG